MKKRTKNKIIGIVLGISVIGIIYYIIFPIVMIFSILPDSNDVKLDKEKTKQFVVEITEYGKIFELDDCLRYTKRINGISVRMNIEETENEYGEYYKKVLKEQEIDEKSFEKFREFLAKSKLRSYLKATNYSIFIVDGFLDSSWGFLYNHTGENIEEDYLEVNGRFIEIIKSLGDNWYRIGSD